MIISKTPYRISFFGGGTDFPVWYREHGGSVLSTTIDKYCYISCRNLPPFFEHKHRIVYSLIENVKSISEIKHPAVRGIFEWLGIESGLEIHHDGDLPARSGLGSSSSFTVGLLNALRAHQHGRYSKQKLAKDAIHIEQNIIGEVVGSQDQVAAAYGGFNHIRFGKEPEFEVHPIVASPETLNILDRHIMLFFTGIQRFASPIEQEKISRINDNTAQLDRLSNMVGDGLEVLHSNNFIVEDFGSILHESWQIKRELSPNVSNDLIDEAYQNALDCGAIGGKILGAGGGGFMLIFATPEKQNQIIERLSSFVHVPFRFENRGASIAMYQPAGL